MLYLSKKKAYLARVIFLNKTGIVTLTTNIIACLHYKLKKNYKHMLAFLKVTLFLASRY